VARISFDSELDSFTFPLSYESKRIDRKLRGTNTAMIYVQETCDYRSLIPQFEGEIDGRGDKLKGNLEKKTSRGSFGGE
jgi:hypothetical protein